MKPYNNYKEDIEEEVFITIVPKIMNETHAWVEVIIEIGKKGLDKLKELQHLAKYTAEERKLVNTATNKQHFGFGFQYLVWQTLVVDEENIKDLSSVIVRQIKQKEFIGIYKRVKKYMSERIKKMETVLAKLKKVDLREYWAHEAHDFTRWLAHEENIQLLSEELSLSLTDVKTEEAIGRYKVDLVAFDEGTQKKVIIENQLEATDHKHLGQIITYASGYNADVIIWIVKDILAEHQKAIEWLNNNTSSSLSFFLIQMELWQIGDSALAPKFHVIVEPNSWAKEIQNTGNTPKEYTETKLVQLDFWEKFISYGKAQKTKMNLNRKPKPQHWYNLSFGTAKAYLHLTINTKDSLIGTGIYIANSEELYGVFESQKKSIEQDMEVALEWLPLEDKKASRIKTETEADISDEDSWHTYFQWLIATTEKIADAFGKYL